MHYKLLKQANLTGLEIYAANVCYQVNTAVLLKEHKVHFSCIRGGKQDTKPKKGKEECIGKAVMKLNQQLCAYDGYLSLVRMMIMYER